MAITGRDIRKFRTELGLTQAEFGMELGFANPQIQISQLESGVRPINRRIEMAISKWREAEQGIRFRGAHAKKD